MEKVGEKVGGSGWKERLGEFGRGGKGRSGKSWECEEV